MLDVEIDKPAEEGVNTFASLLDTTEEFENNYEVERVSLNQSSDSKRGLSERK